MDRNVRAAESACGIIRTEGMTVPKTVKDSILRCLNDEAIFDFAVVYIAGARAGYRSRHRTGRDENDPYLYEGTDVLVNKLNIRDRSVISSKIRDVVPIRIAETERYPITEPLSADYLKKIHRMLYGDIFDWAGEFRTISCNPLDCRPEYIEDNVRGLFDELKTDEYLSENDELPDGLAHLICELHAISPFREGNGPCIRTIANIVAMMNGRYLDYSKASESLYDIALRRSLTSDTDEMADILRHIITDY